MNSNRLEVELQIQLHVSEFDPVVLAHEFGNSQSHNCRENNLDDQNLDQDDGGGLRRNHGLPGHDLSHQSGGSHTGTCGIAGHFQQHGAHRTQDRAGKNGRKPKIRWAAAGCSGHGSMSTSRLPCARNPPNSILPAAGHGEPDHVAAAADGCRSGRQTGQIQDHADEPRN